MSQCQLQTHNTEQKIPYPEQSPPEEDSDGTNVDILDVCEEAFHDAQDDAVEDEAHPDFALELNELKQLVEGRGPSSVLDLHLNIVRILDSTGRVPGRAREESPVQVGAALLNYMNKMTRILALSLYTMLHCTCKCYFSVCQFPPLTTPTPPPLQLQAAPSSAPWTLMMMTRRRRVREDDRRRCVLCGGRGDSRGVAGRLLPLRYNEWIHANCALWSSEVGTHYQ